MKGTLIIAGSGPSAVEYDWPDVDADVMAISSGIYMPPVAPDHWALIDEPRHFIYSMDEVSPVKHIPHLRAGAFGGFPSVQLWPTIPWAPVTFDHDKPLGTPMANSMIFGVQVAHRLGYQRLAFIGCDLLGTGYDVLLDCMRCYEVAARQIGMEWVSLSPISRMCSFLPTLQEVPA